MGESSGTRLAVRGLGNPFRDRACASTRPRYSETLPATASTDSYGPAVCADGGGGLDGDDAREAGSLFEKSAGAPRDFAASGARGAAPCRSTPSSESSWRGTDAHAGVSRTAVEAWEAKVARLLDDAELSSLTDMFMRPVVRSPVHILPGASMRQELDEKIKRLRMIIRLVESRLGD